MIRVRLLLVLAGILSVSWFLSGFNLVNEVERSHDGILNIFWGLGVICGPILFLSAAIILVFSFFRVSELPNGRLAYDPTNWHWRVLKKVFNVKGSLSLCAAFWMTAGITFVSVVILGFVVLFSAIIINGKGWMFLKTTKQMVPLLAFMGGFALPAILKLTWPSNKKVEKICWFLVVLVVVGWFVVAPFYLLVHRDGLMISAALMKYLWGAATALGIVALAIAAFGIFVLLVKYLSSVSPDNLLKRLFLQIYSNLCPILHENSPANE